MQLNGNFNNMASMKIYRIQKKKDSSLASTASAPDLGVPWTIAMPHKKPLPTPIDCPLHPRSGKIIPDIFESDIPLFSNRLVDLLKSEGINNLQTYEARLLASDGIMVEGFKAVNILDRVSCADLSRSVYDPDPAMKPPLMSFSMLVVDSSKIKGAKFFRLGEDSLQILVIEPLKQAMDAAGLVGVEFVEISTP